MASPGDALGADHALAHRPELRHRRLRTGVSAVDAELDAAEAAADRAADHQILDPPVEARAAHPRHIISVADLEDAARRIDAQIGAHPDQLARVEYGEGL